MRQILTGGAGLDATELADYVEHLPRGCALWQHMGGPLAWSDEVATMAALVNGVDILIWQNTGIMTRNPKGKQPAAPQPPQGVAQVLETRERLESKREKRAVRTAERKRLRATE